MNFDAYAAGFDTPRRKERADMIARRLRVALAEKSGGTALEFGCGTGLISFALRPLFARVLLTDTSREMIRAAQEKISKAGASDFEALHIDLITDDPPAPAPDAIYTSMVLHHIRDVQAVLSRFHLLLAPGGMVSIVELDEDGGLFHAGEDDFDGHDGFSHGFMRGALLRAGFSDIMTQTFYHGTQKRESRDIDYSLFLATGVK